MKNTAANAASTGIVIITGCVGAAQITNCSTDGCKVYRHSNSSNTDGNKESWTGGICGGSYSSSFENCTVNNGIVETKYNNRNTGGLVGKAMNLSTGTTRSSFKNCSFEGSVNSESDLVGGIVAWIGGGKLENCGVKGDVSGGIIGYAKAPGSVTNCYTVNGTLKGAQHGAGIASDCGPTLTVENCYSTLTVNAKYGMGCIVGRFCNLINPNSQGTWQTQYNNVLRGCIAWGAIESTLADGQTPATGYSSGAVLGCTVYKSTLSNCWRKPDMSFRAFPAETGYNTLFDKEDSSPESPYVKVSTETYYMPYHGKAANEGETISDVAARIGWDTTIWDLSGAEPKLK